MAIEPTRRYRAKVDITKRHISHADFNAIYKILIQYLFESFEWKFITKASRSHCVERRE